jgi:hypothetical protein
MSEKSQTILERETTVLVTRELKVGKYKKEVVDKRQELEQLAVHQFVTEPAVVKLSKGLTMGFGNFQFGRFDVGVTLPCYAEEVPDAIAMVDQFVEERLGQEAQNIQQYFQATKGKR